VHYALSRFGSRSSRILFFVTALLMRDALAPAQPAALTFDQALQLAAERSQQLVANDAAARAARAMSMAAAEGADPMLTVGINNMPINGPDAFSLTDDFMTMRSIGLARELTRGDRRDARSAQYVREAEVAEAGRVVAIADLQRGAAAAWLERYYQERIREVLIQQRTDASLQIEAADLAFRSRAGPQVDILAARSSVAEIDDRVAENARDIEVATLRLERWIGDDAQRSLGAAPATNSISLQATDLEGELAHHPEIALMIKQEELARAGADVARTNKRSNWTVEVEYSQRGPDFSNMVSVNFSKPLQWREKSRQDQELAALLSVAEQAHAERQEETRAHVADARALIATWRANRERLDRYAELILPLAAERTRAAATAYRAGNGSLGAVLDARVGEMDARLDHLNLEMETAVLWAELNFLIPNGAHHE